MRKKKTLKEIFDDRLIYSLKVIANALCNDLKVKYKSFDVLNEEDSSYYEDAGYNADGHIRIRLKNPTTNRYHPLMYLIDTTVHEVIHLIHHIHNKKFWELHKKCLKLITEELKDPSFSNKNYWTIKDHIRKKYQNPEQK